MDDIYDIKAKPNEPHLILSASKDFSIRLWNLNSFKQIAIFAGHRGHFAEVLSIVSKIKLLFSFTLN